MNFIGIRINPGVFLIYDKIEFHLQITVISVFMLLCVLFCENHLTNDKTPLISILVIVGNINCHNSLFV